MEACSLKFISSKARAHVRPLAFDALKAMTHRKETRRSFDASRPTSQERSHASEPVFHSAGALDMRVIKLPAEIQITQAVIGFLVP